MLFHVRGLSLAFNFDWAVPEVILSSSSSQSLPKFCITYITGNATTLNNHVYLHFHHCLNFATIWGSLGRLRLCLTCSATQPEPGTTAWLMFTYLWNKVTEKCVFFNAFIKYFIVVSIVLLLNVQLFKHQNSWIFRSLYSRASGLTDNSLLLI